MDQKLKDIISDLEDDEFLELKAYIEEVYSQKQEELEKKQAERVMAQIRINSNIIVNRGGKHIEALVVGMDIDKIVFEAKEYERRQSCKYSDVVKIL